MIIENVKKEIEDVKQLNDFEAREVLKGMGFKVCMFVKQFCKVGTEEYKENYKYMFNELGKIYDRARKGLKSFRVRIKYKTRGGEVFEWECENMEEKTRGEVLRRIKQKKFRNLRTNRKIEPIFENVDIKEVP